MPKRNQRPALAEFLENPPKTAPAEPEGERLLTEAQVRERVPISRVTLWRWEARGEFP
jgi:hypothetical protein